MTDLQCVQLLQRPRRRLAPVEADAHAAAVDILREAALHATPQIPPRHRAPAAAVEAHRHMHVHSVVGDALRCRYAHC